MSEAQTVPELYTASGDLSFNSNIVFVDSAVLVVLTLPAATDALGQATKKIKRLGAGVVRIEPQAGESIDGNPEISLVAANEATTLTPLPDGSGWAVLEPPT